MPTGTARLESGRWMAVDTAGGRSFVADTEAAAIGLLTAWRNAGRPQPSNAHDLAGRRRTKRTGK